MSSKSKKTAAMLVAPGVVSGLINQYVDWEWVLVLPLVWGLFALGAFFVFLAGLSNDREAVFFGVSAIAGFIVFIWVGYVCPEYSKHQKAVALVEDLTAYQARHGKYPVSVKALDKSCELPHLHYRLHSGKQGY